MLISKDNCLFEDSMYSRDHVAEKILNAFRKDSTVRITKHTKIFQP